MGPKLSTVIRSFLGGAQQSRAISSCPGQKSSPRSNESGDKTVNPRCRGSVLQLDEGTHSFHADSITRPFLQPPLFPSLSLSVFASPGDVHARFFSVQVRRNQPAFSPFLFDPAPHSLTRFVFPGVSSFHPPRSFLRRTPRRNWRNDNGGALPTEYTAGR